MATGIAAWSPTRDCGELRVSGLGLRRAGAPTGHVSVLAKGWPGRVCRLSAVTFVAGFSRLNRRPISAHGCLLRRISRAQSEDEEQVEKLLDLFGDSPDVRRIVYCDPHGMRKYRDARLIALEQLCRAGEKPTPPIPVSTRVRSRPAGRRCRDPVHHLAADASSCCSRRSSTRTMAS